MKPSFFVAFVFLVSLCSLFIDFGCVLRPVVVNS